VRVCKYVKLTTQLTTQYFELRKYEDGFSIRFYYYRINGDKSVEFTQDVDGTIRVCEPYSELSYMHNALLRPCGALEYKEAIGVLPRKERSNG